MEIAPARKINQFGDVYIGGQAKVQLGDAYAANRDLFEDGTKEECREALRTALAFEGMLKREQQILLSDISSNSFQWIRATNLVNWLTSTEPFYWIAGKPGSGKSTLMKHLIKSKWTLDALNQTSREPWKIVYFYFDYRAGKAVANDHLGMMRRFVHQLCDDLAPEIKSSLNRLKRKTEKTNDYIEFLAEAVRSKSLHICAFVDGLDEYDGDLWELCEILDRLQDETGMKMCLASRPEDAFRNFLSMRPSISMQEHNSPSIANYIERKVLRRAALVPWIYDLFPATLQRAIRDRAEGIILWAKLVVDEMVDCCDETTTTESLTAFLETLPRELESLYDRILGKINNRFKGEAALVVYMLTQAGGSQEKNHLYTAWSFVQVNTLKLPAPQWPLNYRAFDTRLNVLLGNMVDTTKHKDPGDTESQMHVRLLHKSLSSYLSKNDWVLRNLPPQVPVQYSTNFFWPRLYTDVLSRASEQEAVQPHVLDDLAAKVFSQEQSPEDIVIFEEKELPFRAHDLQKDLENVVSPHWKIWRDLLTFSLTKYPDFHENRPWRRDYERPNTTLLDSELQLATGASRILLLHCAFCKDCALFVYSPWHVSRAKRLYAHDALHIFIDISHRRYDWLMNPLTDRLNDLTLKVSEDVFDIVLLSPKLMTLRDKDILARLAKRGTQLQGRHLCFVKLLDRESGIFAAYENAFEHRSSDSWILSHDSDCRYFDTNSSLAEHWHDIDHSNRWRADRRRQLFERCTIRVVAYPPRDSRNPAVDYADEGESYYNRRSNRHHSVYGMKHTTLQRSGEITWSSEPLGMSTQAELAEDDPHVVVPSSDTSTPKAIATGSKPEHEAAIGPENSLKSKPETSSISKHKDTNVSTPSVTSPKPSTSKKFVHRVRSIFLND